MWTSDSNDSIDRQVIQRGASYFFPLSVLGAHVGPRRCHITGRELSMELRAATALMGHLGLEMNLLTEPAEELQELKEMIRIYKLNRSLIHGGDFFRVDGHSSFQAIGVIDADRENAIYSVAQTGTLCENLPPRFRFPYLDDAKNCTLNLLWPSEFDDGAYPSSLRNILAADPQTPFSGRILAQFGIQLPNLNPGRALVFQLTSLGT